MRTQRNNFWDTFQLVIDQLPNFESFSEDMCENLYIDFEKKKLTSEPVAGATLYIGFYIGFSPEIVQEDLTSQLKQLESCLPYLEYSKEKIAAGIYPEVMWH